MINLNDIFKKYKKLFTVKSLSLKRNRVSVIIPSLNEEATIGKVIEIAKKSKFVDEIIVIDDGSVDNTKEEAIKHGAKVITSAIRGKGYSMKEGMIIAKNDILVYLDADIPDYQQDIVSKLASPIVYEDYDFVKSCFDRNAGRVTELVAKPLLSLLFPELNVFSQPLSGMIAVKRDLLSKVHFENDYGVDIGLLIDIYNLKAKIKEVDIGYIENKSKPWQELGKMSREVAKAILKRAELNKLLNLDDLQSISIIQDEMIGSVQEQMMNLKKIIIFNPSNAVISSDILFEIFKAFGLEKKLNEIRENNDDYALKIKLIAKLFEGIDIDKVKQITNSLGIDKDFITLATELKKRGYLTVIVSNGFDFILERIREKTGIDYLLSNKLEFNSSKFTGEVHIPSYFLKNDKSICNHSFCKSNALLYLSSKYEIPMSDIIYVGDNLQDLCSIKISGVGIAYKPKVEIINKYADVVVEKNIKDILKYAR
ncbi:MAG TPA: HAD-IB family phosphatase [Exilispira sp.]|nr:HAD-IB family phosphatase [Exilispira sp.]HNV43776.1 HAD-IB family phosphatase [Exilispira sp.]HQJ39946.1 HAD-IB family phosphatase [Exilispira sp.]